MPDLTVVRRFEAAGFRAWPAAAVHYDGAWAIRLSPDHPARRLNSINPLDPDDGKDLAVRIERAAVRFRAIGRPLTFRLSPLAGPALRRHLDAEGWWEGDESLVMRVPFEATRVDAALDHIPFKDVGRFVAALSAVRGYDAPLAAGIEAVLSAIPAEAGLFVVEQQGRPVSTAVCVHDRDIAGLFEVATAPSERGKGHASRLVLSALKWARQRGATQAWLQVEATNRQATALYRRVGFTESYRYSYRHPAEVAR